MASSLSGNWDKDQQRYEENFGLSREHAIYIGKIDIFQFLAHSGFRNAAYVRIFNYPNIKKQMSLTGTVRVQF